MIIVYLFHQIGSTIAKIKEWQQSDKGIISSRKATLKYQKSKKGAKKLLNYNRSKKSKESLTHYKEANRTDLAEQEEFELSVFKEYLPEDMSQEEVEKMIEDIMEEKSIQEMSQIGQVMGELKKRSNNRADMGFASKFVKEKLS